MSHSFSDKPDKIFLSQFMPHECCKERAMLSNNLEVKKNKTRQNVLCAVQPSTSCFPGEHAVQWTVCSGVVHISVFSRAHRKNCLFALLSTLSCIYSVWLCLRTHAYDCVCVNVCVNLLLPPPHVLLLS